MAAPFACAIAVDGSVARTASAALIWRTASANRVLASGPMLPRRVSMKSDTERTRDRATNSASSSARFSRSAASRSCSTAASSRSRSASALVSWVNAPSGSVAPDRCAAATAADAASRAASNSAPWGTVPPASSSPAWRIPAWVSSITADSREAARRMSPAALSTASSSELAWLNADSAARTQSTSSDC